MNKLDFIRGMLLGSACAAALILPASVQAQTAKPDATRASEAPASNSPGQDEASALSDIIVTAQRRSENLQRVPIAITAISGADLARSGIDDTVDLSIRTPGLTTSAPLGAFQPRIRGIGTSTSGPGIENSVATYVDGVYIASQSASLFSLTNIQRIEVLKGPQGTLFGRNATGGLISVITRDPSSKAGGTASIGYGNYDTVDATAYVTGGVGDILAADISAYASFQGDGYGKNFATGRDANRLKHDYAIRSKWLLTPVDGTELRFIADYSNRDGSYPQTRSRAGDTPTFGPPGPGGPWDVSSDIDSTNKIESGGVSLRIDQRLGGLSLVSISAYRKSKLDLLVDLDTTPARILDFIYVQHDRQFSQELQLNSASDAKFQWVVGAFYFDADAHADTDTFFSGPLVDPAFPLGTINLMSSLRTKAVAGFGQGTYHFGKGTSVTAGLRYSSEKRSLDGVQNGFLTNGTPIGLLGPPVVASKTFNKLTWRLAVDQQVTDHTLVYASYNRGFKSGGFNALIPTDPSYLPEQLDAYEVGVKTDLLDRRLRINAAAFYYDYKNIQTGFYSVGQLGIKNGPKATIYGVDLDVEAAITPAFRLNAGLSLLHDRFGTFPDAVFNIPQPAGNGQSLDDATGNRIPFTPDWTLNLGADYRIMLASGRIDLNATYFHNDGFFSEVDNLRRQTAYDQFNASAAWTSDDDRLTVRIWGKNLSNEAIAVQLSATPFATGTSFQPPRTYGASLGVKF